MPCKQQAGKSYQPAFLPDFKIDYMIFIECRTNRADFTNIVNYNGVVFYYKKVTDMQEASVMISKHYQEAFSEKNARDLDAMPDIVVALWLSGAAIDVLDAQRHWIQSDFSVNDVEDVRQRHFKHDGYNNKSILLVGLKYDQYDDGSLEYYFICNIKMDGLYRQLKVSELINTV